jgi:hypothetical protein
MRECGRSDQRITDDSDKWTTLFARIILKAAITPFTIIYYTYKCADTMGWTGPVAVFGYFLLGALQASMLLLIAAAAHRVPPRRSFQPTAYAASCVSRAVAGAC